MQVEFEFASSNWKIEEAKLKNRFLSVWYIAGTAKQQSMNKT